MCVKGQTEIAKKLRPIHANAKKNVHISYKKCFRMPYLLLNMAVNYFIYNEILGN